MGSIKIDKRRIQKSEVKQRLKDGTFRTYLQYRITIPEAFVEEHGKEVYLLADGIGIIAPNKEILEKILAEYPNIKRFAKKLKKKEKKVIE